MGHDAPAQRRAELAKRARSFGDRDAQQRFPCFADLRPLRDEAQAVEVHIGAAQQGDEMLIASPRSLDVRLESCNGQRAGRLDDGSRIVKDVFDRAADLIVVDQHDFGNGRLNDRECMAGHLAKPNALAQQTTIF